MTLPCHVMVWSAEESATNEGVNMLLQKTPGYPTGTCAVLVNGSERSLVANLGTSPLIMVYICIGLAVIVTMI